MGKVIAITNQKGGVGKTVTTACLSVVLANRGKKVLAIDFDPQGSLTNGLGYRDSQSYKYSITDAMLNEMNDKEMNYHECIIHTEENIDLIPSNLSLSGTEIQLTSAMSRETVFKRIIANFQNDYDYILIDCNPSLNLFTINALTVANSILIPVQAEPYSTDGLNDLLNTIKRTKRQLNPDLDIDGILITMTDSRTNLSKHIANEVREKYGKHINVFKTEIPRCIKTAEAPLSNQSPILYGPKTESTKAYEQLAKEVLKINDKKVTRNKYQSIR